MPIGHFCACGNVKSKRALICRECYDLLRLVRADANVQKERCPHDTCECGNQKLVTSKRCRECWLTETRKPAILCMYCGNPVKDRRSKMCKPCSNERAYQRLRDGKGRKRNEKGVPSGG